MPFIGKYVLKVKMHRMISFHYLRVDDLMILKLSFYYYLTMSCCRYLTWKSARFHHRNKFRTYVQYEQPRRLYKQMQLKDQLVSHFFQRYEMKPEDTHMNNGVCAQLNEVIAIR